MSEVLSMDKNKIVIFVEAYWEIRPVDWGKKDASGVKYVDIYHGGWNIKKCAGHPEINGGMGTPDMCAFFPNPNSVRKFFIKKYEEQYPDNKIVVKLTVTKDERNPTITDYF